MFIIAREIAAARGRCLSIILAARSLKFSPIAAREALFNYLFFPLCSVSLSHIELTRDVIATKIHARSRACARSSVQILLGRLFERECHVRVYMYTCDGWLAGFCVDANVDRTTDGFRRSLRAFD